MYTNHLLFVVPNSITEKRNGKTKLLIWVIPNNKKAAINAAFLIIKKIAQLDFIY